MNSKINELRAISPEAGLIYSGGGYLVISVRTQKAQHELFKIVDATWCLNYSNQHKNYGGKPGYLQYNIFNFNLPVTDQLYIVGNTIDPSGHVSNSHQMNDNSIVKSRNFAEHLRILGYPEELIKETVDSVPREREIKTIVARLQLESDIKASEILFEIIKSSYKLNLEEDNEIRNVVVGITRDQIAKKISRKEVFDLYSKYGVLSTFSGRILNILIPDLTDEEKAILLNNNDKLVNDPAKGLKLIVSKAGRAKYPQLTSLIDNEEKIKDIISSGESITSEGF